MIKKSTPELHYSDVPAETWKVVCQQLIGAPAPIRDVAEHLSQNMGKGIRTRMLAGCAMDEDGMVPYGSVHAAAAIELLHAATLVHDDIVDDTKIRRGLASVQNKFGKEKAVLSGDWLLCRAIGQAILIEDPPSEFTSHSEKARGITKMLVKSAEKVCIGELAQREQYGNVDLTFTQYIKIIDKKTAALFYLSAYVGSILGQSSEKETSALLRYARYFGLVFQIMDDIKDYTMEEADVYKPVKHDLLSGVITIPLIFSFMREPKLKTLALQVMQSRADITGFVAKVKDANGIEDAQSIARAYGNKALVQLEKHCLQTKQNTLTELLDLALCTAQKT